MLTSRVIRGAGSLFVGRGLSQIIGVASTLVAARLLMPTDFGLVAIASSVFYVLGSAIELPIATALVQLKTVSRADLDTAWTLSALRGVLLAGLMLLAAWPVALLFEDHRLIGLIAAMALYPVLLGLRNPHMEMFVRDLDFSREAIVEVVSKAASFLVVLWIAVASASYWALPLGLIASGVVALVMSYALRPTRPAFTLSEFRKFFGFSVWLGLAHIADSLRENAATFLLGKTLGAALVGSWSLALQVGDRLEAVVYTPMERALFAAFSSIQDDLTRIRAAYLSSLQTGFAFILPMCAGIALLAYPIVEIAFGPNWREAAPILQFAAPIAAIYMLGQSGVSVAISMGKTRPVLVLKLIALALHVPLLVCGTVMFGLAGALWASLIASLAMCALSFQLVERTLGIPTWRNISAIGRSLFACACMTTGAVWVQEKFLSGANSAGDQPIRDAVLIAALGATLYTITHLLAWIAAGRPAGVERFVIGKLSRLRAAG